MKNRFTQKAQNALNAALTAATEMGHNYIGSEHLLLGLCREENGVAAHYLKSRGVDAEKVKNAILRLAGAGVPSAVSASDMTPRTRSIISIQAVAELRQTALSVPQYSAILLSNSFVLGPVVIQPERIASVAILASSSLISGGEKGILRFFNSELMFYL